MRGAAPAPAHAGLLRAGPRRPHVVPRGVPLKPLCFLGICSFFGGFLISWVYVWSMVSPEVPLNPSWCWSLFFMFCGDGWGVGPLHAHSH